MISKENRIITEEFNSFSEKLREIKLSTTRLQKVKVYSRNIFQVWKLHNFSLIPLWQKFRESNDFTKDDTKYIVDITKYFSLNSEVKNFHEVNTSTKEL